MNTFKLICGIAAFALLTDAALAKPNASMPAPSVDKQKSIPAKPSMILNEKQMDTVTAGFMEIVRENFDPTFSSSAGTLAGAVAGLTATVTTAVVTAVVAGKGGS